MNELEKLHTKLHNAFLEDHQHLTRGFSNMRVAILGNDISAAKSIAKTMNIQVGPHIEFEERVFYPQLEKFLGKPQVAQLYVEHQDGLAALRAILDLDIDVKLSELHREDLVSAIDAALEHAFSCGTLLSHLDNVDDTEIENLISQLEYYRKRATPWLALADHASQ